MAIINVGPTRKYTGLQAAFNDSVSGDTLLIDEGIYYGRIDMRYKYVNLIGNTKYPGLGKVILTQDNIGDPPIYLHDIGGSPTVYIENIKFLYKIGDDTSSINDIPINIYNCWHLSLFFNRCTIDVTQWWPYFIHSNTTLRRASFHNCILIWQQDTDWDGNGSDELGEGTRNTLFDFNKSIVSRSLEIIDPSRVRWPCGLQLDRNVLNTSNTTGDLDNLWRLFGNLDREYYASKTGVSAGQIFSLYTTFSVAKKITRVAYWTHVASQVGKVELFASNDEVSWDSLNVDADSANDFRVIPFYNPVPYKYFRLDITCQSTTVTLTKYVMLEEGNDFMGHDYKIFPGKEGYGPHYGTPKLSLPTQYYFSGDVTDLTSDNLMLDTVTFNPYDKSPKVSLSSDKKIATVSSSNKYFNYGVRTTLDRNEGKWYWEFDAKSHDRDSRVGLGTKDAALDIALGGDNYGWGYNPRTGDVFNGGISLNEIDVSGSNDIVGIAYDAYNGKIWFSINGQWQLSGNPATGENPTCQVNAKLFPMASLKSVSSYSTTVEFITAKEDLNYDIPEGFKWYGTSLIWRIKAINADTNELQGYTHSDPVDSSYHLTTTYSGLHFLICEDASEAPIYNDLLLGRMTPEVWI